MQETTLLRDSRIKLKTIYSFFSGHQLLLNGRNIFIKSTSQKVTEKAIICFAVLTAFFAVATFSPALLSAIAISSLAAKITAISLGAILNICIIFEQIISQKNLMRSLNSIPLHQLAKKFAIDNYNVNENSYLFIDHYPGTLTLNTNIKKPNTHELNTIIYENIKTSTDSIKTCLTDNKITNEDQQNQFIRVIFCLSSNFGRKFLLIDQLNKGIQDETQKYSDDNFFKNYEYNINYIFNKNSDNITLKLIFDFSIENTSFNNCYTFKFDKNNILDRVNAEIPYNRLHTSYNPKILQNIKNEIDKEMLEYLNP